MPRPRPQPTSLPPTPGSQQAPQPWALVAAGCQEEATGMSQIPVPNPSVTSDKPGSLSGPVSSSVKWGDMITLPLGKSRVGVRGFYRFQPGISQQNLRISVLEWFSSGHRVPL